MEFTSKNCLVVYNEFMMKSDIAKPKLNLNITRVDSADLFTYTFSYNGISFIGNGKSLKSAKRDVIIKFFEHIKTTPYNDLLTSCLFSTKCDAAVQKKINFPDSESARLIWIDTELTGLDVEKDFIMEVACIITDANLDIVSEGPDLIVHHSEEVLSKMVPWCVEHHGKSGLTEASIKSNITLQDADTMLTAFVQKYTPAGKCCLAGNSVYMDRLFIQKQLPNLHNHFHYRIIDVSSLKELCKRWNYEKYRAMPPKKLSHRALDDIKDSIEELRFYKSHFCKTDME